MLTSSTPLTKSVAFRASSVGGGQGLQTSALARQNRDLRLGQLVVLAALSASFCSRSVSAESILKNQGTAAPSKVMADGGVAGACETTNGVPDLDANSVSTLPNEDFIILSDMDTANTRSCCIVPESGN